MLLHLPQRARIRDPTRHDGAADFLGETRGSRFVLPVGDPYEGISICVYPAPR